MKNDYTKGWMAAAGLMILIVFGLAAHASMLSRTPAAIYPAALNYLTNVERIKSGELALKENPLLDVAAKAKAEDMVARNYFAHISPDGKTPWYWFNQVGYPYLYAGENLAVHYSDSGQVTAAWMNSVTHKANILKQNYTEIGTAVATGTWNGLPSVYVVQLYASPRP